MKWKRYNNNIGINIDIIIYHHFDEGADTGPGAGDDLLKREVTASHVGLVI